MSRRCIGCMVENTATPTPALPRQSAGLTARRGREKKAAAEGGRARRNASGLASRRVNESAHTPASPGEVVFLLKGYPRLSETFIAQEIRGLEAARRSRSGSCRCAIRPTARPIPITAEIRAPVAYLPEYLYQRAAAGCWRGWWRARRLPGYRAALRGLARRPAPRSDAQPRPALRPGAGAGGRAAAGRRAAARPFPPHARLRRPLCRADDGQALERLGPCQGHLDDARLGEAREARGAAIGWSPARRPALPI